MADDDYDAGNPAHVKERRQHAKHAETRRLNVVHAVMQQVEGREWIHGILTETRVFATCFSTNALTMALNEGERNFGLKLLGDITRSETVDFFTTMLKEAKEREDGRRSNRNDGRGAGSDSGPSEGDGDSAPT